MKRRCVDCIFCGNFELINGFLFNKCQLIKNSSFGVVYDSLEKSNCKDFIQTEIKAKIYKRERKNDKG